MWLMLIKDFFDLLFRPSGAQERMGADEQGVALL